VHRAFPNAVVLLSSDGYSRRVARVSETSVLALALRNAVVEDYYDRGAGPLFNVTATSGSPVDAARNWPDLAGRGLPGDPIQWPPT
jgi:hypothetical protein